MPDERDARFRDAVAAIDAGTLDRVTTMLAQHPELVQERLDSPGPWLRDKVGGALDGFFERPYLLWFVAEDPVRNGTLPGNIAAITQAIIDAGWQHGVDSLQVQLDYALRLVSWSWIARQCGVQRALIDVLVDAGALPDGNPNNALVNGNFEAAAHLVARGAPLTLATALCLDRWDEAEALLATSSPAGKQFALTLSALRGRAQAVRRLLRAGADPNAPCPDLYPHGTPVHHAVSSGSLETVKVLVEGGANLSTPDSAFQGTPLGWALYALSDGQPRRDTDAALQSIVDYLRSRGHAG
jgi:peptide-methionine (S)-S-oxide reductase